MITNEHKYCLLQKKLFVDKLSVALSGNCGQVSNVSYEAFESFDSDEPQEFLVITFFGGAISVRNVHMNSHSAILRELGRLVDGGYYTEVEYYENLLKNNNWHNIFVNCEEYDGRYKVVTEDEQVFYTDDYLNLVHGLVCGQGLDCDLFEWNESTQSYERKETLHA